jgi:hypothetical protein
VVPTTVAAEPHKLTHAQKRLVNSWSAVAVSGLMMDGYCALIGCYVSVDIRQIMKKIFFIRMFDIFKHVGLYVA